ncbi:MAG TPA: Gfo/Idh/MocA family oxidoreductase, partial [Longimicrobiales bacterium]|nr:Gfo/Idh/MocA family oxidoreductase [Longimicrobiales bacterium]
GSLGDVRYVESVFHNAYGPDKSWCFDPEHGGGALLDLGIHQIDLVLWILGFPPIEDVSGRTWRMQGDVAPADIEDFAVADLRLSGGTGVHIAVSWNAHAGSDCLIRTTAFGSRGGGELRNVNGSFYDFEVFRHEGRHSVHHGSESREWMDRRIVEWVHRLGRSRQYDPAIESSVTVAEVIDAVYGRTPIPHQ